MIRFPKKRWFALVLLVFVLVLFYRSNWLGRVVYPIFYREEIETSARQNDVDPLLVAAIIRVESNYKPNQTSHKGAVGIMQVMPDTAEWLFEKDGLGEITSEDLKNPKINIQVGTRYLGVLNNQFKSNPVLVIASYNAGPGNVTKWLQNNTWDGSLETASNIPFWETRKYVNRVVYYYNKYTKIYAKSD